MFFELVFSKHHSGFLQKDHSAQHFLLFMTEKWKKCLDRNGVCGTLLTDLSQAFDYLSHPFLIENSTEYLKKIWFELSETKDKSK